MEWVLLRQNRSGKHPEATCCGAHLESQHSDGGEGKTVSLNQPGLKTKNLSEKKEKKERKRGWKERKKEKREREM